MAGDSQRKRGQSINLILTSFGIRQHHQGQQEPRHLHRYQFQHSNTHTQNYQELQQQYQRQQQAQHHHHSNNNIQLLQDEDSAMFGGDRGSGDSGGSNISGGSSSGEAIGGGLASSSVAGIIVTEGNSSSNTSHHNGNGTIANSNHGSNNNMPAHNNTTPTNSGVGGSLTNMFGTTPFDMEDAPHVSSLPISLVLGTSEPPLQPSGTALESGVAAGAGPAAGTGAPPVGGGGTSGGMSATGSGNNTGGAPLVISHNIASSAFEGKEVSAGSLKNVRHFVHPAVPPTEAKKLHLDLPVDGRFIEPVDEEGIRQRKDKNGLFSLRLTPFIDHSATNNPGLFFDPIVRTAGPSSQLVIGRYTERVREAIGSLPDQFHPVVFKSKVVSRTHGVFKVDEQGNWYVRDVKSSSGTFLNHQRLAQASVMSKDFPLKDGDILQLGMDFRGGTEEIYRCVRMRVELNKSWKRRANAFNKEALARLRNLQKLTAGLEEEDCSICLCKIKPCQAIFISPCSHSWHYQCIRRLVMTQYPQFVCPNCRSSCDLEASLDSDDDDDETNDDVNNSNVAKEDYYNEVAMDSQSRSPVNGAIQEENEEDIQMLN